MKRIIIACFALLCVLLCGCGVRSEQIGFYSMGTYCGGTVYGGNFPAKAVESAVVGCENLLSHRVPGSDTAALNSGSCVDSEELSRLIALCGEISARTNGKYNVLSLPVTSLWDFSGSACPPESGAVSNALQIAARTAVVSDGNTVSLTGGGLDFGSAGKGYACEKAVSACREAGCEGGTVYVGGSVGVFGSKNGGETFRIALRDPFGGENDVIGSFTLCDRFVSTSGSYEKCFEYGGRLYHHIIDMTTGYPAESEYISVSVVSESGALSDILSTACFMLAPDEARSLLADYGCEGVFIFSDGRISATKGLDGLFTAYGREVEFA